MSNYYYYYWVLRIILVVVPFLFSFLHDTSKEGARGEGWGGGGGFRSQKDRRRARLAQEPPLPLQFPRQRARAGEKVQNNDWTHFRTTPHQDNSLPYWCTRRGGGGGLGAAAPLEFFKYTFSGKKKNHVIFGQNHLIFGQAMEKIFEQLTSAPLNEDGPVRSGGTRI